MRIGHFSAMIAALALAGCSSFVGGDLVRQGEPVGAITIMNNSGIDMNVVTLSRCNAMSHGLNVLSGGDRIANGTSRTWQVSAGCWDIGVGRTGSCSGSSCGWHEAYDKVQVPAGQTVYSRWGSNGKT